MNANTLGQTEQEFAAAREVVNAIANKGSAIVDSIATIDAQKLAQGVIPYPDISSLQSAWWVARRSLQLVINRLQEMSQNFTKFITPATSINIGNTMMKASGIIEQALMNGGATTPEQGSSDYQNGVVRSVTVQAELAGMINELASIVSQFSVGGPAPTAAGPTAANVAAASGVLAVLALIGFALS